MATVYTIIKPRPQDYTIARRPGYPKFVSAELMNLEINHQAQPFINSKR